MKKKAGTENNSFCAFLRGVNVKGTAMKMTDACSVFEKVGMKNVSFALASGTIIRARFGKHPVFIREKQKRTEDGIGSGNVGIL